MTLSHRSYNALKWGVSVCLPAVTTLISALGDIYGWAYTDPAIQTLTAITTFMGSLLMVSTHYYHKGESSHDTNR